MRLASGATPAGGAGQDEFSQKGVTLAAGGTPPDFSGGNSRFHMAFFNAGALFVPHRRVHTAN